MKSFLSPVLIILVALTGYYYILPMYNHIGQLQEKKDGTVALRDAVENMEAKLAELETEYQSFSTYEQNILGSLIPRTVTEVDLIHDLTAMAKTHNLSLVSVDFTKPDEVEEERINLEEETVESESASLYKEWSVAVSVTGSYESFKNFISDMGRNIRITDVSHILITESKISESELSSNTYEVSALVYSIE